MGLKSDLIAARALIDTPEKWRKGSRPGTAGPMCAANAVAEIESRENGHLMLGQIYKAVLAEVPKPFTRIWTFNDHQSTTHADIMALFQRAIAAAPDEPEAAE